MIKTVSFDVSSFLLGITSCAGSMASVQSTLGAAVSDLLGVSLPVLLAAVAGAFIARSFTTAGSFFSAAAATIGWVIAGCVLAPLVASIVEGLTPIKMPANVQAGIALLTSAFLPIAWPIMVQRAPEIFNSWIDRIKARRHKDDDGPKGGGS